MPRPDTPEPDSNFLLRQWYSFRDAFNGLMYALYLEKHFQFHVVFAVVVLLLAWGLNAQTWEWTVLLLCISHVLSLELLNTAVERAVDLASPQWQLLAKQAKDCAAAAVLVSSVFAAVIGVIIFLPKLWHLASA